MIRAACLRVLVLVCLAGILCTRAMSQTPAAGSNSLPCGPIAQRAGDDIDRIATRIVAQQHVPGLSLAVIRDGKVMKIASYGWSDLEHCVPATPDSLFGIGSISKQFTAAGVLLLAAQGKLSLDDPIVRSLPEGAARWQGIAIRHLLTHTSGIKDYCGDDNKYPSMTLDRAADTPTPELVANIAKAPLNFQAGDDWAYSNTGYLLLSVIVERVSGQPFPRFMREKVFAPAGMNATRYYSPSEVIPHRAIPYHVDDDGRPSHGPYISDQFSRWGDMGIISTPGDMAKWALAMNTDRPFPRSLWQTMETPVRLNHGASQPYGFGLQLQDFGGVRFVGHGGSFRVGYTALFMTFPARRIALITMSNFMGPGPLHESLAREIVPLLDPTITLPGVGQEKKR